jgi:hypothetical protein
MINLNLVDNVELDGIDTSDYPEFCDAFITYAELDGIEMTDEQLDELNDESEFVLGCVYNHLF